MNTKIDDVHTNLSTSLSTLETAHYFTCSHVSELEACFQTMSNLFAPEDIMDLKKKLTLHQQILLIWNKIRHQLYLITPTVSPKPMLIGLSKPY
jgi:hypothetical protein